MMLIASIVSVNQLTLLEFDENKTTPVKRRKFESLKICGILDKSVEKTENMQRLNADLSTCKSDDGKKKPWIEHISLGSGCDLESEYLSEFRKN